MSARKLWGGRFRAASDPVFSEFNNSLPFDWQLIEADVAGSVAYSLALQRAGVLTAAEGRRIRRGLKLVLEEHRGNPDAIARSDAEDVHSWVESKLAKHAGEAALKLHTGRSRNDQVVTDLRLHLRGVCDEIDRELGSVLRALLAQAERNPAAALPGYTHLQRAQPVLWPHYLLAYGEMFLRDRERLRQCRARTSVCPLGSGALSGTVYAVDRSRLAADLGFDGVSANSMDAVADRDFVLDFLYFASVLMMHLSRLSEDLVIYSSSEFGFIELDDRVASGSSLMPQKKNPDAPELIRGKAGRVFGHLVGLLTVLKGLPMTYNKDMQEDKEGLFDSVRTTRSSLRMMALVLESVQFRPERAAEAASTGFLNATELADYLSDRGMPFREAHHLAGRIVLRAADLKSRLEELPLEEYRRFSPLFDGSVYRCLGLSRTISRRKESGGTAPTAVKRALREFRRKLPA
jgi:argininosuccinate lyase